MIISKIGLGVAALGLSLTSLAVPAQGSTTVGQDRNDRVSVDVRNVNVNRDGDIRVRVRYFCDSRQDGQLKVELRQDRARYTGEEWVDCDGRGVETVTLKEGHGRLRDGRARVEATLRVKRDRAADSERVPVEVRDRDHR